MKLFNLCTAAFLAVALAIASTDQEEIVDYSSEAADLIEDAWIQPSCGLMENSTEFRRIMKMILASGHMVINHHEFMMEETYINRARLDSIEHMLAEISKIVSELNVKSAAQEQKENSTLPDAEGNVSYHGNGVKIVVDANSTTEE